MQNVQFITALNAVTATTTSSKIWIGSFKKVAVLYRAASITSGTGAFTVKAGFSQLASDTPTVTAYNMLVDNLTADNGAATAGKQEGLTTINSKTLSSNIDAMLWMRPESPATHLEITVTRTTDGTYSAYIIGFD